MTIEIDFSYVIDGFYHSVNYYRSETPMNPESMPAATATGITGLTYTDTTATKGINYYVRFGSVRSGVEKISNEYRVLAGTAWTPDNLSAQIYLDADDLSGTSISSWTDRKTGKAFTQATSTDRPVLQNIAGKKALYFDGAGDRLINTESEILSLSANKSNLWCFVVAKKDGSSSASTSSTIFYVSVGGVPPEVTRFSAGFGNSFTGAENKFTTAARRLDSNSVNRAVGTVAANDSNIHFLYSESDYSSPVLRNIVDGTADGSITPSFGAGSTSNTNSQYVTIGDIANAGIKGWVYAIIFGNTSLSTTDRQKLEGWAAHKYGLTANLPSGHPYKTNPPVV